MTPVLESPVAARAGARATYAAFIANGFAFASWAARIPQVRDRLELSASELGLLLLAIAAGSLVALPLAGIIVARLGSRQTVTAMAVVNGLALSLVAVGHLYGLLPVVIGLIAFGFATGAWDVAMNVQGALVERRLGRAIMPRFHAGFSIGTVTAALLGAGMVALDISVVTHLLIVAGLVVVVVPLAVRGFIFDADSSEAPQPTTGTQRTLAAWREPRTLLVGLFVLAFAFAEGTGNDWTTIAFIDSYGTSAAVGTLGFAVFLTAMTVGRWFGPGLLDRYGRVPVVRGLAVVSLLGVLLFVFGGSTPLAFVGAVLWGAGLSLGFPVGMSAGADEPEMASARVSVIASIAYTAFLGGPPLIGFLGEESSVLRAITAVAVLLAVAILIAGAIRPPVSAPADPAAD
jgi:fucose permease